jgi:crotonobetainyl-CoA:carnitine CoA-transferase CaiB-like acyl-CoA transferase
MEAQDGYIALVYQEKDWPALCDMVDDVQLTEPRFATISGRAEHRAALMTILRPWFAVRTRADITQAAQRRRIPIGPVLWPQELLTDAQYIARGFLQPDGTPQLPLIWDGMRVLPETSHAA